MPGCIQDSYAWMSTHFTTCFQSCFERYKGILQTSLVGPQEVLRNIKVVCNIPDGDEATIDDQKSSANTWLERTGKDKLREASTEKAFGLALTMKDPKEWDMCKLVYCCDSALRYAEVAIWNLQNMSSNPKDLFDSEFTVLSQQVASSIHKPLVEGVACFTEGKKHAQLFGDSHQSLVNNTK